MPNGEKRPAQSPTLSWSPRSRPALAFMDDLRSRLEDRPQLSTDGLKAYVEAVEGAFGGDVDFAQVVKEYASAGNTDDERRYSPATCTSVNKRRVEGNPDLRTANTSYVERSNLTIRMGNHRFTRLTNGFSKKIEKHVAMLSLYFCTTTSAASTRRCALRPRWKPDCRIRCTTWLGSWG